MKTDQNWRQVDGSFLTAKSSFKVRARGKIYLYEVRENSPRCLCGIVEDAEETITFLHQAEIREIIIEAEKGAECYLHDVEKRTPTRFEQDVFTSLDTPRQMSPEMEQITRMMRANDLHRRAELNDLRQQVQNANKTAIHDSETPEKPSKASKRKTEAEQPEGRAEDTDDAKPSNSDGGTPKRTQRGAPKQETPESVPEE